MCSGVSQKLELCLQVYPAWGLESLVGLNNWVLTKTKFSSKKGSKCHLTLCGKESVLQKVNKGYHKA